MSTRYLHIDDRELLKLLDVGLGASVAAKHLDIPLEAVSSRIRTYVACGILCQGRIDWKAYGRWMRNQAQPADVN